MTAWTTATGNAPWIAAVDEDERRVGVRHSHSSACADGSCGLSEERHALSKRRAQEAIAFAVDARDALVIAKEGPPVLCVTLVDIGDEWRLRGIVDACMPVLAKVARPSVWPLIVAAMMGVSFASAGAAWCFNIH